MTTGVQSGGMATVVRHRLNGIATETAIRIGRVAARHHRVRTMTTVALSLTAIPAALVTTVRLGRRTAATRTATISRAANGAVHGTRTV